MSSADRTLLTALAKAQSGRLDDAVKLLRQAVGTRGGGAGGAPIQYSLLLVEYLCQLGQPEQAIFAAQQALQRAPKSADAHAALGLALQFANRFPDAADAYRAARTIDPRHAIASNNLATLLPLIARFAEAEAILRETLAERPDDTTTIANLAAQLVESARAPVAVSLLREALARRTTPESGRLDLLFRLAFALNYDDSANPDETLAIHRAYGEALTQQTNPVGLTSSPSWVGQASSPSMVGQVSSPSMVGQVSNLPSRDQAQQQPPRPGQHVRADPIRAGPLRVGLVSGDFREHSVARFIEPLLTHHDRAALHLTCYSNLTRPDATTARLRALADQWRDIANLPTAAAREQIYRDAIDILIDLSGLTEGHRLDLFAARSAPIQLTWIGYPNTTGLASMDARLVDAITDPPTPLDQPARTTEQLRRLPGCFLCYHPAPRASGSTPTSPLRHSATPPLPVSTSRPFTFGSFNTLAKLSNATVDLWSRVLREAPTARLLLKAKALADPTIRQQTLQRFASRGVTPDRLELLSQTPSIAEHLALYERIDAALDTYPYHGTTTTCEALHAGVPVITLAGTTHASRVGASLLTAADMPNLIAKTADEYVALAASIANGRVSITGDCAARIAALERSPLMDGRGHTRGLESALASLHSRSS